MTRLARAFFEQNTLDVARGLLGCRLVRVLEDGRRLAGVIVETEAYVGEEDRACHAACGRTARNAVMYGPAGHAYVYFIYGMYYCINVVAEREGFPAAALLRALEPCEGLDVMVANRAGRPPRELTSGPGRLCQALGLDRRFNGRDLCADAELFLEAGAPPAQIVASRRIGITNEDALARERPWRFYAAGNPSVSRKEKTPLSSVSP